MTDTTIPVASITVPDARVRAVDPDWVAVLAADISERELVHPVAVTKIEDGYRLISGAHRLAAFKALGREAIPARVLDQDESQARLTEIMENMIRNPLTALERARSLYEIDGLYKAIHPELKQGGDRKSEEARENQTAIFAVRSDILDKVGLSERSFRMGIAIWKGLSPASREAVTGTWMAGHQAQLQALSGLKAKMQAEVLAILFPEGDAKPKATTVADALELIRHGRLPGAMEKKFASLNKQIGNLDEDGLTAVFTAHEERLITWLKARGRI